MTDLIHTRKAIVAADQVVGILLGVNVRKALDPLNRNDFLSIASQVASALEGDVNPYEASAVARAIDGITGVDWAALSPEQLNAAIDAIRSATADIGKVVMPSVNSTFEIAGTGTMEAAREGAITRFGFDIGTALSQRDLDAEKWIRTLNTLYVRDIYGVRADQVSTLAREIVTRGVADGLGSDTIAAELARAMPAAMSQPASYWQVIATAFSNTGRTFSQLGAFSDAGVQRYRFEAVLDEVTTDQCRFYHDQVFSVGASMAHMSAIQSLDDPQAVRDANPWIRSGRDSEGNRTLYFNRGGERTTIATIDRSGVGTRDDRGSYSGAMSSAGLQNEGVPFPPLHGNCRSTVVPEV